MSPQKYRIYIRERQNNCASKQLTFYRYIVLNQTEKIFDPNVLTVVWARRFAGYKRADMLLYDLERFEKLISNSKYPIQIIWAGKPYPKDYHAIETFNHLINFSKKSKNLAVLIGYEMDLSKKL